jgi:NAD(P)-dependent dehydrogenase (short-subunit alcohol dehydrogenase family)
MDPMSNERKFFMEIQGGVVVVTGASSGIGLAIARSFAQAGSKVVLAARSSETINAVAEELRELGYEALTSTGMVVVLAEYVAEKIVWAARNEPEDLFLDEGLLKEKVS